MRIQYFFIILLSVLIISCGKNNDGNNGPLINYVNTESFNLFKTSILEKINKNQQDIQKEKALFNEKNQELTTGLNHIDSNVKALEEKQSQQSIDLKQFERDLKKIMEKQYALSKKVVSQVVNRKASEKKKDITPALPLVLSGIVRWGDHVVVTLLRHDNTVFLRLNESIDGWRLAHVDIDMNKVTFIHNKTQKTVERQLP